MDEVCGLAEFELIYLHLVMLPFQGAGLNRYPPTQGDAPG